MWEARGEGREPERALALKELCGQALRVLMEPTHSASQTEATVVAGSLQETLSLDQREETCDAWRQPA